MRMEMYFFDPQKFNLIYLSRSKSHIFFVMLNRRTFLKQSATLAAATPFLTAEDFLGKIPKHIGVQLWSVREDMAKDAKGTIQAVSKMGYKEVEPFGYNEGKLHGMSYGDFGKLLKDNGLKMPSAHAMVTSKQFDTAKNDITDDVKKALDAAAKLGLKYVVCPYMQDEDRKQIDVMVRLYNATAKYAKKAGVRFAYHNHNFEFEQKASDGRLLIEWLLQESDPKLMTFEMDLYWVYFARQQPLDWFAKYPGRWELCHAKDMAKSDKRESIEVGDGVVDFKGIFQKAKQAGLKHYIVELEAYKTTPIQGVDRARQGLLKTF
jgi:sugar phosphate isomerase/epimerase